MGARSYQGARWYNPANGRFNRLDPFFGNLTDPQSLHKYLYTHGDPIQGTDPSGKWNVGFSIAMSLRISIAKIGTLIVGGAAIGAAIGG